MTTIGYYCFVVYRRDKVVRNYRFQDEFFLYLDLVCILKKIRGKFWILGEMKFHWVWRIELPGIGQNVTNHAEMPNAESLITRFPALIGQ